jgi:hypothetical protein
VHEPRHISINSQAASGKVITNSSSTTAISEYRKLTQADIEGLEVLWQVQEFDGSIQQTHYIPSTFAGTVEQIKGIVNIAVAGGTNTYELQIDGIQVTGSPHSFTTVAGSGGTAGDIVTVNPSAANIVAIDSVVTLVNTSTANTETALDIRWIITLKRT